MNIQILGIKFNHNPGTIDTNALTIRKNYLQSIAIPEWIPTNDGENSKAAYSIKDTNGKTITIQAKFSCDTPNTTVKIRAQGGGHLGTVAEQSITIADQFFSFSLAGTDLQTSGVCAMDIAWEWQYQMEDGTWADIRTTHHKIYTVLEQPNAPWSHSVDLDDNQLPWTDLLDVVCVWSNGATTSDAVAKAITEQVYALGENDIIAYDTVSGGTHYAWPDFQCTQFLRKIQGGVGLGDKVNCSDCATIVSTFANILGANLGQSRMGINFKLRSLRAIGTKVWAVPFNGSFSYHEVAWKTDYTSDKALYDACLELNTNKGAGAPVSLLPVNMVYGQCDQDLYRAYLTTTAPNGCTLCVPMPDTAKRRKVV